MSELVEVLSVIYKDEAGNGAAPSGTISVFDGKRGMIIYRRRRDQTVSSHRSPSESTAQNGNNDVELVLTGPYRAISAEGCVAIVLDLHHDGCKGKDKAPTVPPEIFLDIYDPSTKYDEAFTKEVRTCACEDAPLAEVKYALLSDAVEAVVEAQLLLGERGDDPAGCCSYVHRIIARSHVGEVVLFRSDDESTHIGSTTIPLERSVLAVPLTSTLTVDLELRSLSSAEIVKDPRVFQPDLDSEHVLSFTGQNGLEVQVKITCSG